MSGVPLLPQQIDSDAPVFVISVAAQLAGMHPQTLRTYDRMGLVVPRRLAKRGRRYSARDIARLRLVQRLSQDEGINLEGIRRILSMQDELDEMRRRLEEMAAVLTAVHNAPPGSRVFTADGTGGVQPRRGRGPADAGCVGPAGPQPLSDAQRTRDHRKPTPARDGRRLTRKRVGGASTRSGRHAFLGPRRCRPWPHAAEDRCRRHPVGPHR